MAAFDPEQALQGGVSTLTVGGLPFKVFVDGWGTPISYVRWPLGMGADLQAYSPTPNQYVDPQDPTGKLAGQTGSIYQNFLHPFGAPFTYPCNLVPVVISAGRDGSGQNPPGNGFGIDQWLTPLTTQANDNLYSYRLRQDGGRGN